MTSAAPTSIMALLDRAFYEASCEFRLMPSWFPRRGACIKDGNRTVVVLSSRIFTTPVQARYTIAHELGHVFTGCIGTDGGDEDAADAWAAEAMLPEEWIAPKAFWPIEDLAAEGGVPERIVRERLAQLENAKRAHAEGRVRLASREMTI